MLQGRIGSIFWDFIALQYEIRIVLQGFLGVMVAGQVLFYFLFKLGKLLRKAIQQAKVQVLTEAKEE